MTVPLHELVARQAAQHPDAVAVVDGERELTYRELDRRANQTAHVLRARGWKIAGTDGAAAALGLHPNTLRSRMQRLRIPTRAGAVRHAGCAAGPGCGRRVSRRLVAGA